MQGEGGNSPPPPPPPPQGAPPPPSRNQYPRQDAAYMIFTSELEDKGSRRARDQAVNAIMPAVPQYMHWSDNLITWGREDHLGLMPNPGSYALVVDAVVKAPWYTCIFTRTLIDGG